MKRTLALLSLALLVALSSCQAPPPPATPTGAVTEPAPTTAPPVSPSSPSPTPTASAAVTESPTATPAGSGACTDAASFVADVTIADYSHFDKRETFTKTWRVKNAGTCTWSTDYRAVYSSGNALGTVQPIPLAQTAPGATLDISVDMAAPPTDGKFQTFYQLQNASGKVMPIDAGDTLWALITVGNYTA